MTELREGTTAQPAGVGTSADDGADFVVIADDGTRVTVQVKVHGDLRAVYDAPKRGLGVRFTPSGIEPIVVENGPPKPAKAVAGGRRRIKGTKGRVGVRSLRRSGR